MSVATAAASPQNPSTIPRPDRFCLLPSCGNRVKTLPCSKIPLSLRLFSKPRLLESVQRRADPLAKLWRWRVGALLSGEGVDVSPQRGVSGQIGLDELLSVGEVLCIVPLAIYSIGCLVGLVIPSAAKPFQVSLGNKLLVWLHFLLVGAVAIGSLIRRRQWQRLYKVNENGVGVDLIRRIEKVEGDMRSSATIVRVLSRQLEKLGIRFRVTRKALKEPISETATLAQKNSEVTRALAAQEDILEKELGEIQKVLLAMQEQQQKQLDLILAIGKAGKLLDTKRDVVIDQNRVGTTNLVPEKEEAAQLETRAGSHAGRNNDRA